MRSMVCLAFAAGCLAVVANAASAQDFKKSYDLPPGGRIVVESMSGNVTVRGTDGSSVVVTATKTGRDKDRVDIEDRSSAGSVDIGVHYPSKCHCDANVDFVVEVPRSTSFDFDKIASMSGDLEIADVTGRIRATAMSGNVKVGQVSGTVKATTMSGDVDVDLARLEGDGALEFTSMSGNVVVHVPDEADADVALKTTSGDIRTDFPIQVHKREHGAGVWAEGRIGAGSRTLHATTMSGDVQLVRR